MYTRSHSFSRNTSNGKESPTLTGRNVPVNGSLNHRRAHSLNGILSNKNSSKCNSYNGLDENSLDLFSSKNLRSTTAAVPSSDDSSDASLKLGRLSLGSLKVSRNGIDDLLSTTEGGKNDYDWLLTPPETPLFPSSDRNESQPMSAVPRSASSARSTSTTKPSRLSVSQSESNHPSRPARSSSVTHPSLSTSHFSTYSSNRSSSILNTSSASVSSYIRPSSPSSRSSSSARPSTPSARITSSRSSTPSRSRPSTTFTPNEKTRSTSRPSTPSSRPHIPANLSSPAARSGSRPSTPTRRSSTPSLQMALGSISSNGCIPLNGRSSAPSSRASSPGPRPRTPQQAIIPPDFPLDTPPNLRTSLPDRPLSAGRSRPGASLTTKSNPEASGPASTSRRQSSPIVTRGRLTEPPARGRLHTNGHASDKPEPRRATNISELIGRKPVKSATPVSDSTGFGRSISKRSLDMAIRHMDIKNGTGGNRLISATTLFPQSVRSASAKNQSPRGTSTSASINANGYQPAGRNQFPYDGNHISRAPENGSAPDSAHFSSKLSEVDIYESTRYDAMFLKEDLKNTSWLHSVDDKADQGLIFDSGLEPLPEPFGLL